VALLHLDPPRPGLVRDESRNGAVAVEIYDLPMEGFGRLVASVAPPLAIGTIELADGEAVKGFLCEPHAAAQATDITDFGGWISYRAKPGGGHS
jgi:allophanate hydrolase